MRAKRLHWTQKAENRTKVLEMAAKGRKSKQVGKQPDKSNNPLLDRFVALEHEVDARLNEIDKNIEALQHEKDELIRAFKNDYHRQNEETS